MASQAPALRTYDAGTAAAVRSLYREMRTKQTLEHVKRMRDKYGKLELEMSVWEAREWPLSQPRTPALTQPCTHLPLQLAVCVLIPVRPQLS